MIFAQHQCAQQLQPIHMHCIGPFQLQSQIIYFLRFSLKSHLLFSKSQCQKHPTGAELGFKNWGGQIEKKKFGGPPKARGFPHKKKKNS